MIDSHNATAKQIQGANRGMWFQHQKEWSQAITTQNGAFAGAVQTQYQRVQTTVSTQLIQKQALVTLTVTPQLFQGIGIGTQFQMFQLGLLSQYHGGELGHGRCVVLAIIIVVIVHNVVVGNDGCRKGYGNILQATLRTKCCLFHERAIFQTVLDGRVDTEGYLLKMSVFLDWTVFAAPLFEIVLVQWSMTSQIRNGTIGVLKQIQNMG
mmetsp:Transcript_21816/g.45546  ORF Transcript_21816/g.45546 Transcript_21816/m.45546 type:complete len:209 (-) Transcript_21816:278-904(-)